MLRYFETSKLATNYAKYRPKYTREVAKYIINFYESQQTNNFSDSKPDLLVDVGCGSGQCTNIFQPYFKKLIGVDISEKQLRIAGTLNQFNNIEFHKGSGENIPVEDKSVDLLVAASAAHWFNLPDFYEEAKRVLKPSGCVSLMSYLHPTYSLLTGQKQDASLKVSQLHYDLFFHLAGKNPRLLNTYKISRDRYKHIYDTIPFSIKQRNDDIHLSYDASVADMCGYMASTSAYQAFIKRNVKILEENKKEEPLTDEDIGKIDPLPKLAEDIMSLWDLKDNEINDKIAKADFHAFILLLKP